MSFQAYLDNIKAKTGKTPDDFRSLAAQKGLTKYGEILAWLKADFGLGDLSRRGRQPGRRVGGHR